MSVDKLDEEFIAELECRLEEAKVRYEKAIVSFASAKKELNDADDELRALSVVLKSEKEMRQ